MAWGVGVEALVFHPRGDFGGARMNSGAGRIGLGIKPTDRLSLLLMHDEERTRDWSPGGAVLDNGEVMGVNRQPFSRTDVGGTWRWSADAQTWLQWSQLRNTGEFFGGKAQPSFLPHAGVLVNVWKHGGRDYTLVSLVYRSTRFARASNLTVQPAGWTLGLAHSMDFSDRHWSLMGSVQGPLEGREPPTFWLRLRWRG